MNPGTVRMEIPLPEDVPPERIEVPPHVAAHWMVHRIWAVGCTLYVEASPKVPPFMVAAVTDPLLPDSRGPDVLAWARGPMSRPGPRSNPPSRGALPDARRRQGKGRCAKLRGPVRTIARFR